MLIFRGQETHTRSVIKAISWRTLGTLDTFAISWFMTGRIAMAGSIAGLEIATKVVWYYCHERVWAGVSWGRHHHAAHPPAAGGDHGDLERGDLERGGIDHDGAAQQAPGAPPTAAPPLQRSNADGR